jgi:hypothetical protein
MATRMQQRRGTAQQWTDADPILAAGEIGFETDTSQFKIGDGVNAWSTLSYFKNLEDVGGDFPILDENGKIPVSYLTNLIDDAPSALDTLGEIAQLLHTVDSTLQTHNQLTTNVHGIADTADLLVSSDLTDHNDSTTGVHGISDTSFLAYQSDVSALSGELGDHAQETQGIHGISDTANLAYLSDVTTHNDKTEDVHGIADTSLLALSSEIYDHNIETLGVHGITDTSLLATSEEISDHNLETISVHGIADTSELVTVSILDSHTDATTNIHGITDTADLVYQSTVDALTTDDISEGDAKYFTSTRALDAVSSAIATAKSEAIAEATAQVNAVIDSAPTALDTLNELAAALGDDANFASTVTAALDVKVASYTPIIQKTDSYTLSSLTERDSLIEINKASAVTITIPTNSTVAYPVGTSLDILQTGTGQVTVAGAGGVTVNATPGLKLRTQWSSATLFKRAENVWVVYGDLTA